MLNVVLIRNGPALGVGSKHPRHLHPPLDLLYIRAGLVFGAGVSVQLIDNWLERLLPTALAERVLAGRCSVAVVWGESSCIEESIALGQALRGRGVTTIAVGQQVAHAAQAPCDGWDDAFDIPVLGEPEAAVPGIVRALRAGTPVVEAAEPWWERIRLRQPVQVEDPDLLPVPLMSKAERRGYPFPFPMRGPAVLRWGYVQTAWGCPNVNRCRFCSDVVRKSSGAVLRGRSPERVVDEIEMLLDDGVEAVCFEDNDLMADRTRFLALCTAIRERGLVFPWLASARADRIDEDMAATARASGAALLKVGVESGTPRIIERLGKWENGREWLERVWTAHEILSGHDIGAIDLVMIGCPDETEAEVRNTIRFVRELSPDYVQVQLFTLYPDTALYRELASDDNASGNLDHYRAPTVVCGPIPSDRLLELQTEFYHDYYLRVPYVLRHLRSFGRCYLNPRLLARVLHETVPLFVRSLREPSGAWR